MLSDAVIEIKLLNTCVLSWKTKNTQSLFCLIRYSTYLCYFCVIKTYVLNIEVRNANGIQSSNCGFAEEHC